MAVDFKTFIGLAPHVSKAGLPVILRGRHGVGKSQVVYQVAKNMGLPVIERRASQMTEGDLVGLPSIDGDRTCFNPPDWFKSACEEPAEWIHWFSCGSNKAFISNSQTPVS